MLRRGLSFLVQRFNNCIDRLLPEAFPRTLRELYTPDRPGRIMLDFGCGSEHWLNLARVRGWQTIGVDFIPEIVANIRAAGHHSLLYAPDFWQDIPDDSLDLVRINHVIEHLYEPRTILAALKGKMRTGARLHIGTPNSASITFKLLGPRWFPLDCPRHLMIFSPRALRRLLADLGFVRIQFYTRW